MGAQISLRDYGTSYWPVAGDSGDPSEIIASPGHIYVPTRSDSDGDVVVEVRVGAVDIPGIRRIFQGVIELDSGVLSVTPPVVEDEETYRMPRPGSWRLTIGVRGEPEADYVALFFDEEEWAQ